MAKTFTVPSTTNITIPETEYNMIIALCDVDRASTAIEFLCTRYKLDLVAAKALVSQICGTDQA